MPSRRNTRAARPVLSDEDVEDVILAIDKILTLTGTSLSGRPI